MDLKGTWMLVFLLGFSSVYAVVFSNVNILDDDEDFASDTGSGSDSGTGGSDKYSTNQTCSPCECQCQCDYPTDGVRDNTEELLQIQKQLSKMRADLTKQTWSLQMIEKHMKRVANDIESPRNPQCPDDFIFDRQTNMCYQLHVNKLTWAEAQRYCQHLGPRTHLAIVDTTEKLHLIEEYLKETELPPTAIDGWDRQVWLGGIKDTSNNQWFWTATGQSFRQETKTLWGPNEPNNYFNLGESCVAMAFGHNYPSWLLNDSTCMTEQLYLCEKQMG